MTTRPYLDERDPLPERWLPVVGYEGLYEVSDLGRVRSLDRILTTHRGHRQMARGRVLQPWTYNKPDRLPYPIVQLCRQGRCKKQHIHRLVLNAFVGPRPEGLYGCHNDGDVSNNALTNLRWDTPSSNCYDTVRHGHHKGALKTHCPAGHPYSGENLRLWSNGGVLRRRCSICAEVIKQRSIARRRTAELKESA